MKSRIISKVVLSLGLLLELASATTQVHGEIDPRSANQRYKSA
jgi:hypothetical protein